MVIGITARYIYENGNRKQFINQTYINAFNKLGFIIIPIIYQDNFEEILSLCDCFLICGGGDVDPKLYNKNDSKAYNIEQDLDLLDYKVIKHSIENKIPLLGICRGLQIINVYFNGTLKSLKNDKHLNSKNSKLEVKLYKHPLFEVGHYRINSYHHQAIDRLGDQLIDIAYSNKVIEVISHLKYNIIGVQFHPELLDDEMGIKLLMRWKQYLIEEKYKKEKNMLDLEIKSAIEKEYNRQQTHIELIASENFVSKDILEACGSVLTNKYAEGYPSRRYYGGCQFVDEVEALAIERAKKLFNAEHANVQPHSGSQANMGVYMAVLQPGDVVLGMSLDAGGHLTHGYKLNFSGMNYNFISYGVDKDSELIDYDELERIAIENKPKMIVSGASAYPRIIDFERIRKICDKVGAYMMVDMAHIAGLIAANEHPSPVPYADFVTSTTHKTLRGPRGGLILCKEKYAAVLDKKVFPGMQGGPLEHIIAAKAICFKEAMSEEYKEYIHQVVVNMKVLVKVLQEEGFRIVSGGSDNHLCLVDLRGACNLNGKEAETLLDSINITCNKNSIPFDPQKPAYCSGLRLGTAAMTTRGFKEKEFELVGHYIATALKNPEDKNIINELKNNVLELLIKFPYNV